MPSIFKYVGTPEQNEIARVALEERCEFDWEKLRAGLARENKTQMVVAWQDLSRFTPTSVAGHNHDEEFHTVDRMVDGRMAVLGLYYLPPHTKVVVHSGLVRNPELAGEVLNAEATAHAVDYLYMTMEMRRLFVNSIHNQQLPPGFEPRDGVTYRLDGHLCSWFDGHHPNGQPIAYKDWNGESFMEGAVEALTDYKATLQLSHEVGPRSRDAIRGFLLDPPAPEPETEPETEPEVPTPNPDTNEKRVYKGKPRSKVVHDSHKGIEATQWFDSLATAQSEGLRACRVCRPS